MEYKVIVVKAVKGISTDFAAAVRELAEQVNQEMIEGWVPQGGVAVGETQTMKEPYLFQAMIRT